MRETPFNLTVKCRFGSISILASSMREACIKAEGHIRSLDATSFEISCATPQIASRMRAYLSGVLLEILTDHLLQKSEMANVKRTCR
jgi:hypothetical protein